MAYVALQLVSRLRLHSTRWQSRERRAPRRKPAAYLRPQRTMAWRELDLRVLGRAERPLPRWRLLHEGCSRTGLRPRRLARTSDNEADHHAVLHVHAYLRCLGPVSCAERDRRLVHMDALRERMESRTDWNGAVS